MNTNQLKYFVAVAEYRSFTKAANQYYISQTAITQQIHALEESMNVQLFNRSSRPVALTPAEGYSSWRQKPFWSGWRLQSAKSRMLLPAW